MIPNMYNYENAIQNIRLKHDLAFYNLDLSDCKTGFKSYS